MGRGGDTAVSVLAFYFGNPSSRSNIIVKEGKVGPFFARSPLEMVHECDYNTISLTMKNHRAKQTLAVQPSRVF